MRRLAQLVRDAHEVGLLVAVRRELLAVGSASRHDRRVVSSWILFGSRIVWCWLREVDLGLVGAVRRARTEVGAAVPAEARARRERTRAGREERTAAGSAVEHLDGDRVGAAELDHDVRVPAGAAARRREGLRDLRPGMSGLFVSFSRSVIAKAAAVATSRPTRVAVVRSRCKAPRFYGSRVRIRLKRASSMLRPVTISTSGRGSDSRSASASGAAAAPSARMPASA